MNVTIYVSLNPNDHTQSALVYSKCLANAKTLGIVKSNGDVDLHHMFNAMGRHWCGMPQLDIVAYTKKHNGKNLSLVDVANMQSSKT